MREVLTRTQKCWLPDDGILRAVALANAEQDISDAMENIFAAMSLSPNVRRPILIDLRPAKLVSRAACEYYRGRDCARIALTSAFIVRSFTVSVCANVRLAFRPAALPTRYFCSEGSALAWLHVHNLYGAGALAAQQPRASQGRIPTKTE